MMGHMYILEEITDESNFLNQLGRGGDFYIEKANLQISSKCGLLSFKDLTHAMRPGKTVSRLIISTPLWNTTDERAWTNVKILVRLAERMELFLSDAVLKMKPANLQWLMNPETQKHLLPEGWTARIEEEKSIRVYSPFAKTRPQKLSPKMTALTVVKAINAGQFKTARCDYYNSIDDWSLDEYMRNRKLDLYAVANDIWSSPKGWEVYAVKDDSVSLNQYSFQSITLHRA